MSKENPQKGDPWYTGWWLIPLLIILAAVAWKYRTTIMGLKIAENLRGG